MLGRNKYRAGYSRKSKSWLIIAVAVILMVAGGALVLKAWYARNLGPVSSSTQTVYFPVVSGSTVHEIAVDLKRDNLVRSSSAFETYTRGRHANLQAGTYALNRSMDVPQIVNKMIKGDVSKSYLTILPGKTIVDIRKAFTQAGYSKDELDGAFNSATYAGHPALATLPAGSSLEGFLYPDSFQKEATTPAQTIVRESLDEMQQHLTTDIVAGFSAQGLNVYQGVTLASIVYQESGDPASQPTIAQVFLTRMKQGMPLQSNVTADYAADMAGVARTVTINSPYNTYLHTGLPPGPIGNMPNSALKAVAHPSNTSYIYFIAGDDGTIHFSSTQAEHEQAIKQYCHKLCAQ
jgi:UPF0755 protein